MDPTTTTPAATPSTSTSMSLWPSWNEVEHRSSFRIWTVAATLSAAASAYHGYKRNQRSAHPALWALGWGILGAIFPIATPAVAFVEGFAKPRKA